MPDSTNHLLPNFFVIGAMKSATTTIHQDLSLHPDIDCGQKELNALTLQPNLEQIRNTYRSNFKQPDAVIRGDVSTTYSMIPEHQGVPEKALELCGPDTKIVYVVREPIARTMSHHQHMMNWNGDGKMGPDINHEVKTRPELISYSQYAMQLAPWIDQFGAANIHVVKFEDYVRDRQKKMNEVFQFLGVKNIRLEFDENGANRSHDNVVASSTLTRILSSDIYRRFIRPLWPAFLKDMLRSVMLSKPEQRETKATPDTIQFIYDQVWPEVLSLQKLIGHPAPLWDSDEAIAKHLEPANNQ